ncbi:hypothetical protein [Stomatohabitans albus]|uniref:hypothetical protein n=1 Tax=Stomatohabitans albus TaxID=3110766 RepID=UPI00300CD914
MEPNNLPRPQSTIKDKVLYGIAGAAVLAVVVGVTVFVTVRMTTPPETAVQASVTPTAMPAPSESLAGSVSEELAARTSSPPVSASEPPSPLPSPSSERPFNEFAPSDFVVPYSTVPAKDAHCGLEEGPLIIPQNLPKPSWDRVDDVYLLPSDPKLGPTKTTGNVRHCFARSGGGLVYAAANHVYQDIIYSEFQSDEAQSIVYLESFRVQRAPLTRRTCAALDATRVE